MTLAPLLRETRHLIQTQIPEDGWDELYVLCGLLAMSPGMLGSSAGGLEVTFTLQFSSIRKLPDLSLFRYFLLLLLLICKRYLSIKTA